MQIGFDVGATKIESVVLKDNGEETNRSRINCPTDYSSVIKNIKEIINAGAEKVVINTYALENPEFIKEASEIFGSNIKPTYLT